MTCETTPTTVNWTHRDRLAALIRRHLNSEISAFDFDEAIDEYRESSDAVVRFVAFQVWFYYDDLKDHLVHLQKEAWDYHQRLLLLLASNCRLDVRTTIKWSWKRRGVAFICLIALAITSISLGLGVRLLLVTIPLGFALICRWVIQATQKKCQDDLERVSYPFASFSDVRRAYHSVEFKRMPYPREIGHRRIRSAIAIVCLRMLSVIALPIVWLTYLFPSTTTKTVARMN